MPCAGAVLPAKRAGMSDKSFTAVATLDELPLDGKKVVKLGRLPILLCRTQDGVFALRNECSHAYAELDCGRLRDGWIACPLHGARFDLETGQPLKGPASEPIETFAVRVIDGTIEVAV
jgi:3-phenylpropionate/trans-cinnamate dioxygenase ferredoxin subunit